MRSGNEPGSETADPNVLHIGRCGRGLPTTAGEDNPTVTLPPTIVKHFRCGPSIVARTRVAARAVKAVSRAQRGRSATEEARSALSARVASRTISSRRPPFTTRIYMPASRLHRRVRRPPSPAEAETAWRERPPPWPRAWQTKWPNRVVAHATVLRLTTLPMCVAPIGRQRTPPDVLVQQPAALIEVGAEQRITSCAAIDRDSCWVRWTRGGNTSRVALFPHRVPPPVPLGHELLGGNIFGMLIQLRIELAIPVTIAPAFRTAIQRARRATWSARSRL